MQTRNRIEEKVLEPATRRWAVEKGNQQRFVGESEGEVFHGKAKGFSAGVKGQKKKQKKRRINNIIIIPHQQQRRRKTFLIFLRLFELFLRFSYFFLGCLIFNQIEKLSSRVWVGAREREREKNERIVWDFQEKSIKHFFTFTWTLCTYTSLNFLIFLSFSLPLSRSSKLTLLAFCGEK